MYSFSIDYLFNRVYDVLLWIKYVWLFDILRNDKQVYLDTHKSIDWDGLRDRGWFDEYLASKNDATQVVHSSLWQKTLESFGIKLKDSDGDGIPDINDSHPYDVNNLTAQQLKERYQPDYTFGDKLRDFFGIGPKDSDKDGVPDSYENAHGFNPNDPDSDHDGIFDGQEIIQGTEPLNPDTDGDGVLDGRDEAPLDSQVSSIGVDSDGDGVSDRMENILGSDIHNRDSDGDGIPDGMDNYILDPNNISQAPSFDVSKHVDGLHLSIQNPILAFFSDVISILSLFILVVFVYVFMRWFFVFLKSLNHYEHHFEHDDDHGGHGHNLHVIKHHDEHKDNSIIAGIPGLPVHEEETPTTPPEIKDFEDHPRFAIIKGYMSSNSEALWRIGIMEADNMLAEVLREKGYGGETVSEMLKGARFKTIDLAWDVHKMRNRIAHEGSDFVLTEHEAKKVFTMFESIFRELKAIH